MLLKLLFYLQIFNFEIKSSEIKKSQFKGTRLQVTYLELLTLPPVSLLIRKTSSHGGIIFKNTKKENNPLTFPQTFTCSKSTPQTLEKVVKYVQG